MSFWVAGATVATGAYAANRAGAAADRQVDAAGNATAETARQYDQTRQDLAPYRVTGGGALNQLGRLFGLPTTTPESWQAQQDVQIGDQMLPGGTTTEGVGNGWYNVLNGGQSIGVLQPGGANGRFTAQPGVDINALRQQGQQTQQAANTGAAPDMSAFFQSPGYQFRRDEGMRGLERTAAARGGAFSGNALRALADFNSGLASQEFGSYVNQLAGIAGVGQSSTNQTASYGEAAANGASRNALFAGDARASGIQNQANIFGQTANGLAGLYGYGSQGRLSNSQFNGLVNPYQITGAATQRK